MSVALTERPAPKRTLTDRVGRTLDRVVGVFSPRARATRERYRAMSDLYGFARRGGYRGAASDRIRPDRGRAVGGSADADLLTDLPSLREASRDLNRNDPIAAGVTNTMTTNIVATGIRPQSRIDNEFLNLTPDQAQRYQRSAERAWNRWSPFADAQNRLDMVELQWLAVRQIMENGEVLALPLMLDEPRRPYMLGLEMIEADRLSTPPGYKPKKPNIIRDGVEMNEKGQPIGYWIRKRHPGDIVLGQMPRDFRDWVWYDAYNKFGRPNVLHLYWTKRPGQTRGEPFFAPVLNVFKDLADYLEAEIIAARVAACFAVFITKNAPDDALTTEAPTTDDNDNPLEYVEPGLVERLFPGEGVEFADPKRPGTTFDPFVERILRSIATALGLPYEIVAKDFSKTNYASARAALLEARRFFKSFQSWLARYFCQPVFEMLMEEAWLRDDLDVVQDLLGEHRFDWMRVRWIAPGWAWVDPVKEVQAAKRAVDLGISTHADECAALGRDWEETFEQLAREQQKADELALRLSPPDGATEPTTEEVVEDVVQAGSGNE